MKGVKTLSYDPKKAMALLKEAGYQGETIEVMINQGEATETEATVLQAQLKRIGMNIKLKVMDRGASAEILRKGNYAFRFAGGGFDVDPLGAYLDKKCEPDREKKRIRNESGYCDSEMDRLLDKAARELNPQKRKQFLKQIVAKANADVPELALGFAPRFFALRDYVKGFTTNGGGDFRPWGGGLNYVWLDK